MSQQDNQFYVTTPIYYVNSKPHVGTSYTTIIADIACRYARFMGLDALLVTGSDEHSQNIADLAAAKGLTPQQFCDEIIPSFRETWSAVGIQNYEFYRTSDPRHHHLVRTFFNRIYQKGDIYKGSYSGWYHTSDNRFLDEDEVPENPESHPRLKYLTEEAYYFRLSRYQDWLLALHETHPGLIVPDSRRNEMLNRIRGGLKDICISRTSTDWGVKLPWDEEHVFYVWMDALLTYVTGSGFDIDAFEKTFDPADPASRSSEAPGDLYAAVRADLTSQPAGNRWPCDLHIMAKDIPWFHTIIFPAVLESYGLPLPKQMLVHGYWDFEGEKMSKSLGNVVSPQDAMALVGVDGLRYFLAREVPLGLDGDFSHERLVKRFNYDLANDLGNLVHRSISMLTQLFDGVVPEELAISDLDDALEEKRRSTILAAQEHFEKLQYSEALQAIWELIGEANKYIDEKKPWELKKKPERRDEVSTVFNRLLQVLRTVLLLSYPVIPGAANRFWGILGLHGHLEDLRAEALNERIPAGHKVGSSMPVFMRVDWEKMLGEAAPSEAPAPKAAVVVSAPPAPAAKAAAAAPEGVISIDDFAKVQLRVGEIRAADKVEGADKLLKLTVFDGERERIILAGIAMYYAPESLVGKQIVFVANLAPRKMRGLMSEGMILAAGGDSGKLALVSPEQPVDPGVVVR